MKRLLCIVVLSVPVLACDESTFVYRLPFANDTEIKVWQDHLTHAGGNQIVAGVNGRPPYKVVAARPGIVRFIADTFTLNCSSAEGCFNNYVWLQHEPGNDLVEVQPSRDGIGDRGGRTVGWSHGDSRTVPR